MCGLESLLFALDDLARNECLGLVIYQRLVAVDADIIGEVAIDVRRRARYEYEFKYRALISTYQSFLTCIGRRMCQTESELISQ